MRTVVLDEDILELEIKPYEMLEKYRQLLVKDINQILKSSNQLHKCSCPGCQSGESKFAFEKFGLICQECVRCKSVYVSPRPSEDNLVEFYRNSASSQFWQQQVFPATKETRRTKLFRPRAQWLLDIVDEYYPDAQQGIVVGYHNNLLIEEMINLEPNLFPLVITNPIADIEFASLNLPGVIIKPTPLNKITSFGPLDIFLAFDILDRCANLDLLFGAAYSILAPGGLFLATTTLISGFDLQILWDHSENIYLPERLNLLSTEGLSALFQRHGFDVLEFSTPGLFDVETVKQAINNNPDIEWPRFIRYIVENRDQDSLRALQEYLQRYRLSSFGRIVLRKPL